MKKKLKLLLSLCAFCLSVAVLCFGVFAAIKVTYTVGGTISYEISDVFVELETRVFSTSKKYNNNEELQTQSQIFERSDFSTLNSMTSLDTDYTFNKVQIKNLNQGEDYQPTNDDYINTYSSVTESTPPEPLSVNLKYSSIDKVYTYFVITKVVNKSSIPLYISVPFTGEGCYVEPENSNTYKLTTTKKLVTKNSEFYVVFAMSLKNPTVSIDESGFTYPISITKEIERNDSFSIMQEPTYTEQIFNLSDSATTVTVQEEYYLKADEAKISGIIINFSSTVDIITNIDLTMSASATVNTVETDVLSNFNELSYYKGNYQSVNIICNMLDTATAVSNVTLTKDTSSTPNKWTITVPSSNFSAGEREFCIIIPATSTGSDGYIDFEISTTSDNLSTKVYTPVYTEKQSASIGSTIENYILEFYLSPYQEDQYLVMETLNFSMNNLLETEDALNISIQSEGIAQMIAGMAYPFYNTKFTGSHFIYYMFTERAWVIGQAVSENEISFNIPMSSAADGHIEMSIMLLFPELISKDVLEEIGGLAGAGLDNYPVNITVEYAPIELVQYELRTDSNTNKEYYAVTGINSTQVSKIEIASNINGIDVTTIDTKVFNGAKIGELIIPSTITSIADGAFGESWSCSIIEHLIVYCEPTVLPYNMVNNVDWDFTKGTINKLTLHAYSGGDLPEFLYTPDPFYRGGYGLTHVYVPSNMVEIAKQEFQTTLAEKEDYDKIRTDFEFVAIED